MIRVSGPLVVLGLLIAWVLWRMEGIDPEVGPGGSVSETGEVSRSNPSAKGTATQESETESSRRGPGLLPPVPAIVDPVFARMGTPTHVRPFPRGKNRERRFSEVIVREVTEAALSAEPVVLAKSPVDGRINLLPEEIDTYTKAARRMVLDTEALEAIVSGKAGRMKVPLPDGTALDLVFHRIRDRGGMTQTLEGEIDGEPQKTVAQFVYHDGIVHGSVARYDIDRHFEYRILSSGFLMVTELDLASMNSDCGGSPSLSASEVALNVEGEPGEESAEVEDSAPPRDTVGYTTIDIVVGYDAAARSADGGVSQIEARIISSVDRMNLAFSNSLIAQTEIMLLGVIEDPYYLYPGDLDGDMGSGDELGDLNSTGSTNAPLNTVSDYANALGADLKAFVIRDADGSAGIAYKPGTSSVTARTYMTSTRITFAHEVGHNIGTGHSWGDSSGDASTVVHNYGWRLAPSGQTRVRTIMAYDWSWGNGSRIPYFANPDVTYQGARTGQVNGYNASGDLLSDSRYVSGGLEGTHGAGFNGSNPSLGARNGPYIMAQAASRANQRTRTNFQVVDPASGVTWTPGDTRQIYWTGGDYEDTVSITLYKGGILQSTIVTGISGEQRKYSWSVPAGLANGNDYMIRVTRNGTLSADSGIFSLSGGTGGTTPQTITFNAIPDQITTNLLTLSATGGASGNPVVFSVTAGPATITGGNQLSFTGAGSVSITASQAGNSTYAPAPNVTRTFQVTKANATVTLTGATLSQTYTGASRIVTATTSPSGLPTAITYGGLATPPVNAGSYAVVATINHAMYQGTVSGTLVVAKASASVTLTSLAQTYNGTPRVVAGTTSPSSLPLTITYNGSTNAPTNAGSYTVVGTINHTNYQGSATNTLVVAKAVGSVTLSNLTQVYTGGPRPATITTAPAGLSTAVTYNGIASAPISAGTYTVSASLNEINYQGSTSGTHVIEKASQIIDFTLPTGVTATQTFSLAATGGTSGNPIVYTIIEGPAEITGGNQVSFIGAGLVRIRATQAGGANHHDATPVERSMTIAKTPATIELSGLVRVYTGNPLSPTSTTTPGGLAVGYTFNGSATTPTTAGSYAVVATINDARYEGTVGDTFVIEKAPATVTFTTLTKTYTGAPLAAEAGSDPAANLVEFTYNGSSTPPTVAGSYEVVATVNDPSLIGSASGTFVIAKAPQPIGFAPIPDQFATETVNLTATGGGSNNPIVFEVVEGSATITGGNVLTFSSEGTVSVRASQAGDANHLEAVPVTRSFNVTKFPATLNLLNLTQAYTGTPRPVAFSTSPANLNVVITYGGSSQAPTVPGTYFVLAVIDEPYHQGDAGGFLTITKGIQTIDFPPIPPQSATATVTLAATGGPSGNPVTFEIANGPGLIAGNQLTFSASGTVTVRARQEGDELYEAATPVLQSITVTKAAASLTLGGLTQTYDGLPKVPMATTTPPGLTVSYTYDGQPSAPTAAGSYALVASISDPRYEGTADGTFVVEKTSQTISFPPLANALANASVPLAANGGGSGNPVTFAVTAGPASLQGGNTLVFSGAGEVTVAASQAGDGNHLAAPSVERTFLVSKAPATSLTLSSLHQVFDGSPREVVVTTVPPGLASFITYEGDPDPPTGTGSYEVVATLDDPIYEGSASGTLVVDDPARLDLVPGGDLPALSALGAIEVKTFSLGRYEVTWGLWKQVRDWAVPNGYDLTAIGAGCDDDHPVRGVNWFDVVKWCNARTEWENATLGASYEPAYRHLGAIYRSGQPPVSEIECRVGTSGYRLPSPEEREYAARGGRLAVGHPYPGGVLANEVAWHAANSGGALCDFSGGRGTRPVGGLRDNELGLHDLAGNLAEWTGAGLSSAPGLRIVPGGHWNAPPASLLHTAFLEVPPADRSDEIGFRMARSVADALTAALDNEILPWESGGTLPWHAQTGDQTDGIDAASIGALGGTESGWVETSVTGPGNVVFQWKIQLPSGVGALIAHLDGNEVARISGATDWAPRSLYVPPGAHVIRWTYQRALPGGAAPDPLPGPNGAWLDAVTFTEAVAPTVVTGAITSIGDDDATGAGNVTADGGAPVAERGIVLSTDSQPVIEEDLVFAAATAGTGAFQSVFAALTPGTTYRARAYATNDAGTGYGAGILFTTDETIDLSSGSANRERVIESGDRHVFHFSLTSPRHADFSSLGGASLRAELFDGSGQLLASFTGDSDFDLVQLLYAGDYELHVYRQADGGPAQDYTVAFDTSTEALTLPDAAVGASIVSQRGVGVYGSLAGQVLALSSKKAVPVSGVATFRNGGTLPDELILSGTGGNALFAVAYLGDAGNVTGQMLTGTLRTPVLVQGDEAVAVRVSVVPNRKKLSKKKGKRTVTLKKTQGISVKAISDFDPSIGDQAIISVRTY